VIWFSFRIAL